MFKNLNIAKVLVILDFSFFYFWNKPEWSEKKKKKSAMPGKNISTTYKLNVKRVYFAYSCQFLDITEETKRKFKLTFTRIFPNLWFYIVSITLQWLRVILFEIVRQLIFFSNNSDGDIQKFSSFNRCQ